MILFSKHLRHLLRRSSCFAVVMDESSHHHSMVSSTSGDQKWLWRISHGGSSFPSEIESETSGASKQTSPFPSDEADAVSNSFDFTELESELPIVIPENSPQCCSSPRTDHNDGNASPGLGGEGGLKSAMKGSRERRGMGGRDMSVKWAPEVYDPPPMTEYPRRSGKKQHRSKSKKGKKQKGKKGSKAPRRVYLSTDLCFKVVEDYECEGQWLDPFCLGAGFLKSPYTGRVSLAEAL